MLLASFESSLIFTHLVMKPLTARWISTEASNLSEQRSLTENQETMSFCEVFTPLENQHINLDSRSFTEVDRDHRLLDF